MIESGNSVLDDPTQWWTYIPAPAEVNRHKFQKRLDRIAGVTASGMSALRLIWGWDSRIIINGEWRQRYAWHTVTLPSGDTIDLAAPRWYIEELLEPAQYMEQWSVEALGPPPKNGFYIACYPIAVHEYQNRCCVEKWAATRTICYGRYKQPGDEELARVERAVQLRDRERMYNRPDEPMSLEVLAECRKLHYEWDKQKKERLHDKVEDCVGEFIRVFGENFASTDPGRHHHGKYHFLNKGIWQQKST